MLFGGSLSLSLSFKAVAQIKIRGGGQEWKKIPPIPKLENGTLWYAFQDTDFYINCVDKWMREKDGECRLYPFKW